jgi:tetratricopeptide (TPR) repeat protein
MPTAVFDRSSALAKAQQFAQRGKLQPAIDAFQEVIERDPRDWASANLLGDVLVRAGQVDRAVEEYLRIAEFLTGEGFVARATGIYRKVLRLQPNNALARSHVADLTQQRLQPAGSAPLMQRVLEAAHGAGAETGRMESAALISEPSFAPPLDSQPPTPAALPVATPPAAPVPAPVAAADPLPADGWAVENVREVVEEVVATDAVEAWLDSGDMATPPVVAGDPMSQEQEYVEISLELDTLPDAPGETPSEEEPTRSFDVPPPDFDVEDSADLDSAFAAWRERWIEAGTAVSEAAMEQGLLLADAGNLKMASALFADASLAPHLRHEAARCIAHVHLGAGAPERAVEWLEWAAEMPPASADAARVLTYDLAVALEAVGQPALAAGVLSELRADVGGNYLDVDARLARLLG